MGTRKDIFLRAVDAEILSPVLPKISDRLSDARVPGIFRAQGVRGKFRIAGIPLDGGSESLSKALTHVREKLLKTPTDSYAWVDYGNLLWGSEKPLLSKIAYERAQGLNSKNAAALNNRTVVLMNEGEEDWLVAYQGNQSFSQAISLDPAFIPAKVNRALLLNYYRIFTKAKPLWEQVLSRSAGGDFEEGLGISEAGLGNMTTSQIAFEKALEEGLSKSRFAQLFHQAAKDALNTDVKSMEKCLDHIDDLKMDKLVGFERLATENLKRTCTLWKTLGTHK